MSVLGLIALILIVCLLVYLLNIAAPGFITPEANRLIWAIVTVVVVVCLIVFVLSLFGFSLGSLGHMNWGPRLG